MSTETGVPAYKTAFLDACVAGGVLTFGCYTLKSGRQSPYFFNAAAFHTAPLLAAIAEAYARTIEHFVIDHPDIEQPDIIFGPAYKGISLACCALLELHRLDASRWASTAYAFNRKEAKDHGEGGTIVGASLNGKRVLVVDDVITAGTAMRQTIELVQQQGGHVIGFVVALDRKERMPTARELGQEGGVETRMSAMGQIRHEYGIPTSSIATLDDVIALLKEKGDQEQVKQMVAYRERYLALDDGR